MIGHHRHMIRRFAPEDKTHDLIFNLNSFDYRLVELRCVPWTASEVSRALQAGRCRDIAPRMAPDTPSRLAYLLQR